MSNSDSQQAGSERDTLAQDAKALNLVQFWEERADIELLRPRNRARPYRWNWRDIEPRLRVAARTVPIEECERRALVFRNPGIGDKPFITNTIFAAYSLYNPGERAPVHRHTPSASRFVLEGDGGFTVVEGEKLPMQRGDLIITPHGTWHDHGNDGSSAVIWVDVLDVPLVESLNATIFEFDYVENGQRRTLQSERFPVGHSQNLYATGGVKPLFVNHRRTAKEHSPMFSYKWTDTRRALERMASYPGSPFDGIIVEYIDPTTSSSVMPTMSFRAQMLRPGETTRWHRRSASSIYCVLEGSGKIELENESIDWRRNDVFAVPGWHWTRLVNTATEPVFLYSVTDEPTMRKLGLFFEQGRTERGEVEDLA
jgi:gentisate 1,2-dioxygenase